MPSEYVRDLIRRDQRDRQKLAELQAAVAQGRNSEIGSRSPDEILAAAKAELKNEG